jgi:predicted histone-like DNA-binding protein
MAYYVANYGLTDKRILLQHPQNHQIMALKYKVVSKRPGGMAGNNTPRYYPVLTDRSVADLRMVADLISERSSMHSAAVVGVLDALTKLVPQLLQDGHNVRLDGFGTFSLHVSGKGQDTPDKVSVHDITGVKMAFLPDKRIKRNLKVTKFVKSKKK